MTTREDPELEFCSKSIWATRAAPRKLSHSTETEEIDFHNGGIWVQSSTADCAKISVPRARILPPSSEDSEVNASADPDPLVRRAAPVPGASFLYQGRRLVLGGTSIVGARY